MAKGIRHRGNGWQLRATVAGYSYQTVIAGPNTTAGLRKAIKARAQWIEDLKLGSVPKGIPPFSSLAQQYLDQSDLKLSTYQTYRQLLNQYWMPAFAHTLVHKIKPAMIREVLNRHPVSQKTKKNALIPLRRVFDLAIEEDFIEANPVASVRTKKHQKQPIHRFTPTEKAQILEKLSGDPWLFYLIAFETGMRTGEILGLRWSDWTDDQILVARSIVRRRLTDIKTHQARSVFISGKLRQALASHKRRFAGGYLFLNSKGRPHLDADTFVDHWTEALKRARVTYRRPYTCRHTRASEMLMAGVEPAFAATQLGHTLEQFFNTYAKWISDIKDADQKAILQRIGG